MLSRRSRHGCGSWPNSRRRPAAPCLSHRSPCRCGWPSRAAARPTRNSSGASTITRVQPRTRDRSPCPPATPAGARRSRWATTAPDISRFVCFSRHRARRCPRWVRGRPDSPPTACCRRSSGCRWLTWTIRASGRRGRTPSPAVRSGKATSSNRSTRCSVRNGSTSTGGSGNSSEKTPTPSSRFSILRLCGRRRITRPRRGCACSWICIPFPRGWPTSPRADRSRVETPSPRPGSGIRPRISASTSR